MELRAERPNFDTNPEEALGLLPSTAVAARATTTVTPNTGLGEGVGMRLVGLVLRKQPSTRLKPNQNRLQMVQTGINNYDEHNGKSDDAHGPPGSRPLQNLHQVGQWNSQSTTAQRLRHRKAATPNKASTKPQLTKTNERCRVWHHSHEKCVHRASTKGHAKHRPQDDCRWNHPMGKNAPHPRTKHTNDQFAGRNLRAFSRTIARLRGSRRGPRGLHRNTQTKRESTECITTSMVQQELMDSIRSGCSPRLPSNKRDQGRDVLYHIVGMTKFSDELSTQKHRSEPNKEYPSKGQILLMVG